MGSKSFLIEQFYLYNQVLYDRPVLVPLDQSRGDPTLKYIARFNGEPVESYTHNSFECRGLTVFENKKTPQLFVIIPKVNSLSVNLLTIEQVYDPVNNVTNKFLSTDGGSQKLESINDKSILENDELIVRFDKRTFMPNQIKFKKLNQIIDLKVQVIRYPSVTSETGAYISAPKSSGVPLKLQIVDA